MFSAYAPRLAPSVAASRVHLAAVAPIRPHALVQLQRLTLQHYSVSRPVVCSAGMDDAPAEPSNRLFVGNLSYNTTAEGLGKHFAQLDGFKAANVAFDPRRQASRGFGFVEFESVEAAQRAKEMMSESELDGRNLLVQPAQVRTERRERTFDRGDRYADRGDRGDRYGDRRERSFDRGDRGSRYGDREERGGDFPRRERQSFPPGTRVWVSNLPFSAEWQDVKEAFGDIGQVANVDVVMRRREGRLMKSGSAVVAFADPETAERAVAEMNGYDMGGREINVRMYSDE